MSDSGDVAVARALTAWFRRHGRALPWRVRGHGTRRDGYRTLVSELMLQQTQVSRVLASYEAFVARFPNVVVLARAREQSVLTAWSGLGYYRRAKHLHGAAKMIQREHHGRVPRDVASLRQLPGVGAYTAGRSRRWGSIGPRRSWTGTYRGCCSGCTVGESPRPMPTPGRGLPRTRWFARHARSA